VNHRIGMSVAPRWRSSFSWLAADADTRAPWRRRPTRSPPIRPPHSGQHGRRLVPGAVAFAVASDVVVPSRIHVRWEIADRLQFPPDPIDSVVVAINYDEPADEKNWRTTTRVLGSFPRSARIGAAVFEAGHPDIVPGRTGWITVVPRHASGSYGAIERGVNHRITDGFFIDGLVITDRGGVAAGVEVTIPAHGLSTLTAPDGRFRFGPLSDESAFILQTNTPDDASGATETGAWFDFTTAPIGAGAPPVTICLIDRTETAGSVLRQLHGRARQRHEVVLGRAVHAVGPLSAHRLRS
jgi:hypothetical protein